MSIFPVKSKMAERTMKVLLPLLLGGAILYWMYRGFDFGLIRHTVLHEMNWWWMLASLPFGVTAQVFRGLRWRQTLSPIGEHARRTTAVNAIFVNYATSLVIPRSGEFVRCGVLKRWDHIPFVKSLGTVVTERAVDSLVVLMVTAITLLMQLPMFHRFFVTTGVHIDQLLGRFTTTGYIVTLICLIATIILAWVLVGQMRLGHRVKDAAAHLWQGVVSLRHIDNPTLYIIYTLGIWGSYFVHFHLTFYCFEDTASLSISSALVAFVVGSIAVIVPTPNGAGPWHFSVKTMLILYGVGSNAALVFVLVVHTVQTFLVVLLGIMGWISLLLTRPLKQETNDTTTR